MAKTHRQIKYSQALSEGLMEAMKKDKTVFVMGQSGEDPNAMFGTLKEAIEKYGPSGRVFDLPLSEAGITGWGTGAAIAGLKPVMTHHRDDFLFLASDQIVNHAAKWLYMHRTPVNWTIRAIIGRGWGQGPQHSQSLQSIFAHIPGLKVVMPSTAEDAKGLLYSSIFEPCPVIVLEHRRLYDSVGEVAEGIVEIPLGKARILRPGKDLTIVAISQMVQEAELAAQALGKAGIYAEVIDPRTIRPLDYATINKSVKKTGRLIICDTGWIKFGVSAEIAAAVSETVFDSLKAPIKRIGLPDSPTPASYELEKYYYPGVSEILKAASGILPRAKVKKFREFATTDEDMQKFIGIF